jgi:asparagine synthase (glutamine-hydrolysing)
VDTVGWYWNEHLSGREDYSFELWGILMFQAWLRNEGSANLIASSWSA